MEANSIGRSFRIAAHPTIALPGIEHDAWMSSVASPLLPPTSTATILPENHLSFPPKTVVRLECLFKRSVQFRLSAFRQIFAPVPSLRQLPF